MNLRKVKSVQRGDLIYSKWTINIPQKMVEKLNWRAGEELSAKVVDGKLVVEKM